MTGARIGLDLFSECVMKRVEGRMSNPGMTKRRTQMVAQKLKDEER